MSRTSKLLRPPLTLCGWQTKSFPGEFVHVYVFEAIKLEIIMCFSSLHLHKMNSEDQSGINAGHCKPIVCLRQLWWVQGWKQNKHTNRGKSRVIPKTLLSSRGFTAADSADSRCCSSPWLKWANIQIIRRNGWTFFCKWKTCLTKTWEKMKGCKGDDSSMDRCFCLILQRRNAMQTYHFMIFYVIVRCQYHLAS